MTEVGNTYGQALYDLAKAESLDKDILAELTLLNDSFQQEAGFLRLLQSPNLSKQERCGILDDSFRGRLHIYVLNFLKILTEKGYARHFPDCVDAYRKYYNLDHNILPVTAVTAVALTDVQSRKLTDKLSALTGKTIELYNRVDPDILGGVRLDYDGKRLDDTVIHRLESVRNMLRSTVL
jgi:F-type H+-transporting ATPase subunit delta